MKGLFEDIRMLKLAELHERAYEAFIVEMAERYVADEDVRGKLMALVGGAGGHGERIALLLEELVAKVPEEARADLERAALLDIIDVEHAAREFYLARIHDVRDPRVEGLFRDLAREERTHLKIAQEALALADERSGRAARRSAAQEALRLASGNVPLWEGTSELRP